ncbi:alpha/beta hydrolase [Geothrix limicola]|uniref:Alpha/beta hydrolase n=1 Tax=Geothrix limicola TaxID=2927978 RepID=A0ABQ5QFG3_9BACT|nr:alpha/beta fold hydrolase [Geothrix limicola]GLH73433.1 alpha/beta hydrolase [Geothrix limicola]
MRPSFLKPRTVLAGLALSVMAQGGVLADHPGRWLGNLTLPNGRTIQTGVELFRRADGSAWASLASPGRGAVDIPVASAREEGNTVLLDFTHATLQLTWTQDHFHGEWRQGGDKLPFELRATAAFPRPLRPQTPKPPFPYEDQPLAIRTPDGIFLGATLTLPKGSAQPDVVVLIGGSGPGNRDEDGGGHQPFAVLADQLARRGLAVLRYDKRGVGRSTGNYYQHTDTQLISDAAAVVRTLRARHAFRRIGLLGHSEGSGLAATVAAAHPDQVDFVISMAGIGLSGLDSILVQDRVYAKDQGASPAEVDQLMGYVRQYYGTILAQADVPTRLAALRALQKGLSPELKALIEKRHMNEGTLSLDAAEEPALRASLLSDIPAQWRAVRCPVLALNGSLDHQVPPEHLQGILAALKAGGNARVESALLPSLNHLFQTAKTGREDEYDSLEETLAPSAIQRVADFVVGLGSNSR